MARSKHTLMIEKKSPRGLVPTANYGKLDSTYNEFLSTVDPRNNDAAQFALATSTDPRFKLFLDLMAKPGYSRWSLATVAKNCDISLPEWAEFWRKSQLQRALAEASNAIPALTRDMVADAASKTTVCERCDGFGTVLNDRESETLRPCPACQGLGSIRSAGDTHSRDKLLEMTGLTGKKGGAAVVINQNFAGMGIEAATDRMDRISFSLDDDIIDAVPDTLTDSSS